MKKPLAANPPYRLPPPLFDARCKACWFSAALVLLVLASFWSLDLQWAQFLSLDAALSMARFAGEFFPPDLSPAFAWKVAVGTWETLAMSLLGTALAAGCRCVRWRRAQGRNRGLSRQGMTGPHSCLRLEAHGLGGCSGDPVQRRALTSRRRMRSSCPASLAANGGRLRAPPTRRCRGPRCALRVRRWHARLAAVVLVDGPGAPRGALGALRLAGDHIKDVGPTLGCSAWRSSVSSGAKGVSLVVQPLDAAPPWTSLHKDGVSWAWALLLPAVTPAGGTMRT